MASPSAHLFGDYDAEKMRAAQADQQAGENVNQITQLDLKLQGVIMASDPENHGPLSAKRIPSSCLKSATAFHLRTALPLRR